MYELVNTSVPNGLIAGTHGFATVAMTKGMPDAIRTRVEGLCAYPHRTSAHDASYYRENPVNWFHLTLPSGDHVIGRTAPSDFDYTGRTNRLARTIVFRRGEMPVSGGCEAIRIAGSRLSEKWSGEPRMLPADKALAAKFFALERSRDATPANWVALFGDNGISLAKRVAMLVARNAMGGGKSVYFKTSTSWDADGTKLLALFSDIINLLPDEAAPLVTFSTFAACVPSGVTCHLRGVYDKDKAFELASATQPWVDCEHGRVMHEELLPSESAPVGVSQNDSVGEQLSTSQGAGSRIGVRRDSSSLTGQAARARDARWQDFAPRGSGSDKAFYTLLGSLAFLVVLVAIGCIWWVKSSSRTSTSDDDQLIVEMNAVEAKEKERAEKEARDKAEQKELEEEPAAKEKATKEADEDAKRQKAEADRKAKIEEEAKKAAEDAVRNAKEEAEREAAALQEAKKRNLSLPLDKLKITKVFAETDNMLGVSNSFEILTADLGKHEKMAKVNHVLAKYAGILTNENSVVVYYFENGAVKQACCMYSAKPHKDIRTSSAKTRFTAEGWPAAANNSPWIICRVVNPTWCKDGDSPSLDVFLWWHDIPEQRLFAGKNEAVDLKKMCFGSDVAKMLFKSYSGKVYYWLAWDDNVYIQDEDILQISCFCDAKALGRLKADYDAKISEKKDEIDKLGRRKGAVEFVLKAIKEGRIEKDNIEHGKGFGNDKLTKEDKKKKKNNVDKQIVDAIKNLDNRKYAKLQATAIDAVERDLKNEPEDLDAKIIKLKSQIGNLEGEKAEKCNEGKLVDAVRKRIYRVRAIDVIPDGMGHGMNTRVKIR